MFGWLFDHIISGIPSFAWAFIVGAGAAGYVIAGVASRLPMISIYAKILRLISIAVFSAAMFMWGGSGITEVFQAQLAQKQSEIATATEKSNDANDHIKYVVVEKLKVIHDNAVSVKQDIKRDASAINSECKIVPQVIKDLNEAAQ